MLLPVFLFRLICLLTNCDPVHEPPEILPAEGRPSVFKRNLELFQVEPTVRTRAGIVEGYHSKSETGRGFFAFEGIPYGESTAGSGRWKSPVPKRPWKGVRQTKKPGPGCLQLDSFRLLKVSGSEDCLFLNVYTPNLPNELDSSVRKLPVIVFIHGGGFLFGSGSDYGPSYMLNQDVILITINYRLGVLGFLSIVAKAEDIYIPGNFGLKDQALALKWVNENVEYFGGDPKKVTIMGNSAGGVSAHLHLISNRTRDYFSSAYSSSGTAFQYWGVQNQEHINMLTSRLANAVGCPGGPTKDARLLVNCFHEVDPNMLVVAQFNLYDWFPFPIIMFSPVVEAEHSDAFLTMWPEQAYQAGLVAAKPLIAGFNENEGQSILLALLPLMKTLPLRVMWDQVAPYYLDYKYNVDNPSTVTKQINGFYFMGSSPRWADLDVFTKVLSDRFINTGVVTGIQAHAESGAPTYFYLFSFSEGNHNFGNMVGYKGREWGAGHVEDMFYFFNVSLLIDAHKYSEPDHELSEIMIKILINFAATGQPTFTDEGNNLIYRWEPIRNASVLQPLSFNRPVEMIELPKDKVDRLKFWSGLPIPNGTLWSPLF